MARDLWTSEVRGGWRFELLTGGSGLSELTDVEVHSPDGRRWVGTVGSLAHVRAIMERYEETGECDNGAYFWATGLLFMREETIEAAVDALESLVQSGEHELCFEEAQSDG